MLEATPATAEGIKGSNENKHAHEEEDNAVFLIDSTSANDSFGSTNEEDNRMNDTFVTLKY